MIKMYDKNFWKRQETITSILGIIISVWIYIIPESISILFSAVSAKDMGPEMLNSAHQAISNFSFVLHMLGSISFGFFIVGFVLAMFGKDLYHPISKLMKVGEPE